MKEATSQEIGVTSRTTKVIPTLTLNINPMVPRIVITPVNSWVNPMSRPSAN